MIPSYDTSRVSDSLLSAAGPHLRDDQNVGIGFTNPQSKLSVNGNFAVGSGFNGVAPTNG